jgi:hypothetical protein
MPYVYTQILMVFYFFKIAAKYVLLVKYTLNRKLNKKYRYDVGVYPCIVKVYNVNGHNHRIVLS